MNRLLLVLALFVSACGSNSSDDRTSSSEVLQQPSVPLDDIKTIRFHTARPVGQKISFYDVTVHLMTEPHENLLRGAKAQLKSETTDLSVYRVGIAKIQHTHIKHPQFLNDKSPLPLGGLAVAQLGRDRLGRPLMLVEVVDPGSRNAPLAKFVLELLPSGKYGVSKERGMIVLNEFMAFKSYDALSRQPAPLSLPDALYAEAEVSGGLQTEPEMRTPWERLLESQQVQRVLAHKSVRSASRAIWYALFHHAVRQTGVDALPAELDSYSSIIQIDHALRRSVGETLTNYYGPHGIIKKAHQIIRSAQGSAPGIGVEAPKESFLDLLHRSSIPEDAKIYLDGVVKEDAERCPEVKELLAEARNIRGELDWASWMVRWKHTMTKLRRGPGKL